MTLSNIQIINIVGFANNDDSFVNKTDTKFSIKFAWNWRKNIKKLRDYAESIEEMIREISSQYMSDEFSYEDENGTRLLKAEFANEYNSKIAELYKTTNDIDIATVNLEDIGNVNLSIPEMDAISFMVEE